MEIKTFVLGPLQTNTYMLIEGKDVMLIDPASKADKLIEILDGYNLLAIILTHGHFDHIKAVDGLYEKYRCPVYIHQDDEALARDKHSGSLYGLVAYISCPVEYLKEGNMKIGPFAFEIVFTPGHTQGSVIIKFTDDICTGDTLFKGSIGRTDLPGGDYSKMKNSLRYFRDLDKDYNIYPGHDLPTKLSLELQYNPYLQ